MAETLFEELKRYVGFSSADEQALVTLHATAKPHFARFARVFYDRILEHEGARQALEGGESQVGHLRGTLQVWMDQLLRGPWDEAYYALRCRIGRMHVRIALPQHYMFGAMNILRQEFNSHIDATYLEEPAALRAARSAVGKILDLELAIMLHTYREDLLAQQARSERLSTFGQLVGSIGHELRNPLGVIETSLYILRGRPGAMDERTTKHLDRIGDQVGIANRIVSDLLDMIRDRPLHRQEVWLDEVWQEALKAVQRPDAVVVSAEGLTSLPAVQGDAGQLRQVFVNLLDNAVQALEETGGTVSLSAATREPEMVELVLEDSGPGVSDVIRRRLFEPLMTTKARGIGLGLALVKRIVERHGGSIAYVPRPGAGARFVIRLSLVASEETHAPVPPVG
ncbi:sensor histidine kinase [Myxococcus xanthus DK 1622]|uniref:histidine kinase n=1 Tax=Myxococcus xanthus (strain DK1622) TaxID=246197 RepID=Q1D4K2_MYXXD|nr:MULTISPECIES: protoglobin domain-containing protein [Myxococcus]ABF93033.1 sensor histidine kinase [Myxococcus xanthus DK 1622]NOJ51198.1 GHKL domain-containing protein [Myxococcus xanthus]QPM76842.1 GHKL domain-containing protein [Myxococcus xanthus]QVW65909.1 GHKL domain-containing protein [Myxococcus xanthus DZ2]QZZ51932.1 Globin-coupled histidine kinase [Myxococcus xanthus]